MPKIKTHKRTKRVLIVRQSGSIKIGHPGTRHNTGKHNTASNRAGRAASTLSNTDYKILNNII